MILTIRARRALPELARDLCIAGEWQDIDGKKRSTVPGGTVELCEATGLLTVNFRPRADCVRALRDFGRRDAFAGKPKWLRHGRWKSAPWLAIHEAQMMFSVGLSSPGFVPEKQKAQVLEVLARASHIRLPATAGSAVVHKFGRRLLYDGFDVIARDDGLNSNHFATVTQTRLDLLTPMWVWASLDLPDEYGWGQDTKDMVAGSFYGQFEKRADDRWSEARCERFFADDANFLGLT